MTVEKTRLGRVLRCLACLPSQQLSRKVVLRTFSLPLLTQLTSIHQHNSPPSPTQLPSTDKTQPHRLTTSLTASHTLLTSITSLLFSLPRTHCSTLYKRLSSTTPLPQTTSHTHTMGVSKKETINPRRGGSRGAQKSTARTSGAASDGPSASKKAKRSMKSEKNPWVGIPNCLAGKSVSLSPFSLPWSTTKHL